MQTLTQERMRSMTSTGRRWPSIIVDTLRADIMMTMDNGWRVNEKMRSCRRSTSVRVELFEVEFKQEQDT